MSSELTAIADELIPPASGTIVLKKNGETPDIIAEVLAAFKDSRGKLDRFAPYLKGANMMATLESVWKFWKQNVRYKVDPENKQLVQEPQAFWAAPRQGDCKSFSVAVMSTLYSLGIKAAFRFASYGTNKKFPTHVYVVVLYQGKEIPVDCVWKEFGTQKPYTKKWDYNMSTAIYRVAGLEDNTEMIGKLKFLKKGLKLMNPLNRVKQLKAIKKKVFKGKKRKGVLNLPPAVSDAVADILLDKQFLEMQQIKHNQQYGTNTSHNLAFEAQILGHDAAIGFLGMGKKAKAKKLVKAKAANTAGKAVSKKQAKILKKAGVTATKVKAGLLKRIGKGITKVIKTPARLALATQLPKNAPFFLYLFITDPKILAKLPEQVMIKRQKALKYKGILVDKLQMKESNFDKTVRNGIMNAFGKPAETVLAEWMKAANFQIGFIDMAMNLAGKGLSALLGKAAAGMAEDVETYTPTPEDWGTVSEAEQQAMSVQQQATAPQALSMEQLQAQQQQAQSTGYYQNVPGSGYSNEDAEDIFANRGKGADDATGETMLNNVKTEQGVTVKSGQAADSSDDETSGGGSSTMLLVGIAAVALIAMNK